MRLAAIFFLIFALSSGALAAVIRVPADYPTIQDAINAAVNGDTVLVSVGTYNEIIDFTGKAIAVESGDGPWLTSIDGQGLGSVVTFANGEGSNSVLQGFTLTNGIGTDLGMMTRYGGGVFIGDHTSPTMTNNIVIANKANFGAGVYCGEHASPEIVDNIIENNEGDGGGGLYCDRYSAPTIARNTVEANKVWVYGSGIYCCLDTGGVISDNTIINNKTASSGAGIYAMGSTEISDNLIAANLAMDGWAGGLYLGGGAPMVKGNVIVENGGTLIWGGGIAILGGSPVIRENHIGENFADNGGGLYCADGSPVIEDNDIIGNYTTYDKYGGGIYCGNPDAKIEGNVIALNEADYGAGLLMGQPCTVSNNILYANMAKEKGGGILCWFGRSCTVVNCTLFGNSAEMGGGGICIDKEASATVVNSILWENFAPTGREIWVGSASKPSTLSIRYSDVRYGQSQAYVAAGSTLNWGAGMIDADPLFVDKMGDDLHVYCTSPCCGTGDNTAPGLPTEDFEGDPRIAGGTVDMGADEFSTHFYWTGNAAPGGGVALKFVGSPGETQVALIIGFNVFDPPLPGAYGDWHIAPPLLLIPGGLGPIPAEGVYFLPGTLPASVPGPYTVYFQAMIGYQLTNLSVMEVE